MREEKWDSSPNAVRTNGYYSQGAGRGGKITKRTRQGWGIPTKLTNRILAKGGQGCIHQSGGIRSLTRYHGWGWLSRILCEHWAGQKQGRGEVGKMVQRSLTKLGQEETLPVSTEAQFILLVLGLSRCPSSICCWGPQPMASSASQPIHSKPLLKSFCMLPGTQKLICVSTWH